MNELFFLLFRPEQNKKISKNMLQDLKRRVFILSRKNNAIISNPPLPIIKYVFLNRRSVSFKALCKDFLIVLYRSLVGAVIRIEIQLKFLNDSNAKIEYPKPVWISRMRDKEPNLL